MADSFVQLPYTATTSGDLLDATSLVVGANTVKRERMVIGNDTSSHVAIVSSSGALSVARTPTSLTSGTVTLSSNPTVNVSSGLITLTGLNTVTLSSNPNVTISSGTVTLSSATSLSSGIVTLSSPTSLSSGTVTLSSNPTVVLSSPTSLSSGIISFSSAPTINISSGIITLTSGVILTSNTLVGIIGTSGGQAVVTTSGGVQVELTNGSVGSGSTAVNVVGSSNAIAPATSSGGLLVTFTNSVAGSTSINIMGSSNAIIPGTSSGGLLVTFTNSVGGSTAISIEGSAGVFAPVTSSGGLLVDLPARIFVHVLGTVGLIEPKLLTTRECRVYSVACLTTAAVANVVELYPTTSTAINVATTWIVGLGAAVANTYTQSMISLGGVYSSGGLTVLPRLTLGGTANLTVNFRVNVEYSI